MSDRLDLQIDVLGKTKQRALALPTLTPLELIAAILQEFRQDEDLDYLSDRGTDYQLVRVADATPLVAENKLGPQVSNAAQLALVEREVPSPPGAKPTAQPIYLREEATGHVYKLHWAPAVIGRPNQDNQWLAVNLENHPAGLSVSRRHACITEENGHYYVESLSPNPTAILKPGRETQPNHLEPGKKVALAQGDTLWLDRSGIKLKFIVRT